MKPFRDFTSLRKNEMRISSDSKLVLPFALAFAILTSCSRAPQQVRFASPDDAAKALLAAFKTNDMERLKQVFGSEQVEAAMSGDPVADRHDREVVALAMQQSWRWEPLGDGRQELIIGDEKWPFPVPLAKNGNEWQFDSKAGQERILARRVGRNELNVINLCRAYCRMQARYASQPHDGLPAGLFAQRLRSNAGREDGLYWPKKPGERNSPLGDLAAEAAADGYDLNKPPATPFWGYYFRILHAQGPDAPGGRKSYVVDGRMPGGHALLAYPAKYGASGVMTFIVSRDGVVYEKDLGKEGGALAAKMSEYNPDGSWSQVAEADAGGTRN
jgi:hypothetical protein